MPKLTVGPNPDRLLMVQDKISDLDFKKLFGTAEESSQQLTLYIPDKDRNGRPIKNLKEWISEAMKLLTTIGGGATAFPPADGSWFDPEKKSTVWEKTTIIYTFIIPEKFEANIRNLKNFLCRFGRETGQGEVVFQFHGNFYKIREFGL